LAKVMRTTRSPWTGVPKTNSLTQKKFPHQPRCFRGKGRLGAINRLFFRKML